MMSKKKLALVVLLAILFIAVCQWRYRAPSWNGQDIHPVLEAGEEFELLLVGDMGTGDEHQAAVAVAMNRYCHSHKLAAIIFLGDNFYPKGVESVDDPQWQSKFVKPYGTDSDCLSKLPFYALLGNHDYKGNPSAQIAYHGKSPDWIMPHRFYDLRIGRLLQLTMIDTNILDVCGFDQYCSIDFMLKSLANTNAPYKIVLGHHPIASASGKYSQTFQGWVLEKLLCNHARYYISGHSHHLEHRASAQCPLDMFVVGGGGAALYQTKEGDRETQFAQSTFGFLSLKVTPAALTFSFYDAAMQKLYSLEQDGILP